MEKRELKLGKLLFRHWNSHFRISFFRFGLVLSLGFDECLERRCNTPMEETV